MNSDAQDSIAKRKPKRSTTAPTPEQIAFERLERLDDSKEADRKFVEGALVYYSGADVNENQLKHPVMIILETNKQSALQHRELEWYVAHIDWNPTRRGWDADVNAAPVLSKIDGSDDGGRGIVRETDIKLITLDPTADMDATTSLVVKCLEQCLFRAFEFSVDNTAYGAAKQVWYDAGYMIYRTLCMNRMDRIQVIRIGLTKKLVPLLQQYFKDKDFDFKEKPKNYYAMKLSITALKSVLPALYLFWREGDYSYAPVSGELTWDNKRSPNSNLVMKYRIAQVDSDYNIVVTAPKHTSKTKKKSKKKTVPKSKKKNTNENSNSNVE